jgi:hypothetical protein
VGEPYHEWSHTHWNNQNLSGGAWAWHLPCFMAALAMNTLRSVLAATLAVAAAGEARGQDRSHINRFLVCIECTFEADSLDSLAVRQPAATRDSLIAALYRGPPPTRRVNMQARFDSSYSRILAGAPGPLPMSRPTYIAHYLSNFVASFQKRAAVALARVGQGDTIARVALDNAIADTLLRQDVRDRARFARDSIWTP